MTKHSVVIAGGGPTGLMLASELALGGADVAIIERRADQELGRPGARGLHSRTIEVLDQRGIADRFLAEGQAVQVQSFARIPLDISDFPTRHNYGLALSQSHFERILAGRVDVGVTTLDDEEAHVKRAMVASAGEVIALATADKLRTASPWVVAQLADIDHLVTDGSGELTRPYTSAGIDVLAV
jgi:2-polyprenyl-6-methoxyphenol hydroxylase-like FAD-dependent oxidoreductase